MKSFKHLAVAVCFLYVIGVLVLYTPPAPVLTAKVTDINGHPFIILSFHKLAQVCDVNIITEVDTTQYTFTSKYRKKIIVPVSVPVGTSKISVKYTCEPFTHTLKKREECNGDRDYIYFCTAILERNTTYCNEIKRDERFYRCIAYITKKADWCLGIQAPYWRDWCITDLVQNRILNESACTKLVTHDWKKACIKDCNGIKDDLARTYCEVSRNE